MLTTTLCTIAVFGILAFCVYVEIDRWNNGDK